MQVDCVIMSQNRGDNIGNSFYPVGRHFTIMHIQYASAHIFQGRYRAHREKIGGLPNVVPTPRVTSPDGYTELVIGFEMIYWALWMT